jgi:hypothetical protein
VTSPTVSAGIGWPTSFPAPALRALAASHPDDAAVREMLALGLLVVRLHEVDEGDLARADALLDELRALAAVYPDDPQVAEILRLASEEPWLARLGATRH